MILDETILKPEERASLSLRALYAQYGYRPYSMSRFEEYELYSKNKDFLLSQNVITFTDTNGRLKALKPDVTLSIIRDTSGSGERLTKVYYNESVYRVSKRSEGFREFMQTGLECIGQVGQADVSEVLSLAAKSLRLLSQSCVLAVSHLDLLFTVIEQMRLPKENLPKLLRAVGEKNLHGIDRLCGEKPGGSFLKRLLAIEGTVDQALPELRDLLRGSSMEYCADQLEAIFAGMQAERDLVRVDFSVVGDMRYYNGIVFRGMIEGIPGTVLSGGQYARLMRRVHRGADAIGFAVYLDSLQYLPKPGSERQILNVALPKGRLGEKVCARLEEAGYACPEIHENSRKLFFENPEKGLRCFWVKPSDVGIYVERGVADLGVVGRDILLEQTPDVFELLDLELGQCRMVVAGKEDFADDPSRTLRVATKFPNIAQGYYAGCGREIDVIPLNGSIELAPFLGLSDVIVDLVETGTTLRENNLTVLQTICPVSARLIANKTGYQFKTAAIAALKKALERGMEARS